MTDKQMFQFFQMLFGYNFHRVGKGCNWGQGYYKLGTRLIYTFDPKMRRKYP